MTLGLCSQRELDALVAKAMKATGQPDEDPSRIAGERDALIGQLRAEREAAARAAEAVPEEQLMPGGFVDPFKR